jgi:hypothetical protein
MPQPIGATVVWDDTLNKGTVADISVPVNNGATVIQWTCGPNVASFTITGLDSGEFNPSQSNANVTTFTTTDTNDTAGDYSYTVSATHSSGRTSTHDPRIENGGGG